MSKKFDMIRLYEFPNDYPDLHVGSVWETKTRRHRGQRRVIIGINKNRTSVFVRSLTKAVAQHGEQVYTINASVFFREHERVC
jgi:hypothetical protein